MLQGHIGDQAVLLDRLATRELRRAVRCLHVRLSAGLLESKHLTRDGCPAIAVIGVVLRQSPPVSLIYPGSGRR